MSQNPSFQWAKKIGSGNDNVGNSVVADALGNSFVTGYNDGLLNFFVSKFDVSGNLSWTKKIFGGYCSGRSISIDKYSNVYVTGYFTGKVDFDPDSNTIFELTSNGDADIFILKFSSLGKFSWVKQIGGANSDFGNAISVDQSGNIYTSGSYVGIVDFNPGTGIYNLNAAHSSIFISKLDTSGNFQWAAGIVSTSYNSVNSITTDKLGSVYATGYFTDTVDFDPGVAKFELMAADNENTFILKLNELGVFMWAKSIESDYDDNRGCAIASDTQNNVFIVGYFRGEGDFNPNKGIAKLYSAFSYDLFILKLDEAGNFDWAQNFGGNDADYGYAVTTDRMCNVYISGRFADKVDFDPLGFSAWMTAKGGSDIFILKLNGDGYFEWVKQMGGNKYDIGYDIATDLSNNIYVTGEFAGTADFDPESPIFNLVSEFGTDGFLVKLGTPVSGLKNTPTAFAFIVYPNPSQGLFNIKLPYPADGITLEVYNSTGILVRSQIVRNQTTTFDLLNYAKGIYLIKVIGINGLIPTQKIIMQ